MTHDNMISLQFTPKALTHIENKLKQQKEPSMLRIDLQKKGCSGLNYRFTFVTQSNPDDIALHPAEGVTVLIEKKYQEFFDNAVIDCIETLFKKKLQCLSPREGARCGCGESFTINA